MLFRGRHHRHESNCTEISTGVCKLVEHCYWLNRKRDRDNSSASMKEILKSPLITRVSSFLCFCLLFLSFPFPPSTTNTIAQDFGYASSTYINSFESFQLRARARARQIERFSRTRFSRWLFPLNRVSRNIIYGSGLGLRKNNVSQAIKRWKHAKSSIYFTLPVGKIINVPSRFLQGLEAKVNKGKRDKIQITVSQRKFITEEYTAALLY